MCPLGRLVEDVQAGIPGVAAALAPGTVEGFYDGIMEEQLSRVVLVVVGGP